MTAKYTEINFLQLWMLSIMIFTTQHIIVVYINIVITEFREICEKRNKKNEINIYFN